MKDTLAERMKKYESKSRNFLNKKEPVIIRLDGKAFHTFTKGLGKPFDDIITNSMIEGASRLCEEIQNCKIAYTQSDEISLLLTDYETEETEAWFNYNINKMISDSVSILTLAFNEAYMELCTRELDEEYIDVYELENYTSNFMTARFDSRVFNLPKDEVNNYFIWRQKDCIRNSIQAVGQANFSHKELHGVGCNEIVEKLKVEKELDYSETPIHLQRGTCVIKETYEITNSKYNAMARRTRWVPDKSIPDFMIDKSYIEKYVYL